MTTTRGGQQHHVQGCKKTWIILMDQPEEREKGNTWLPMDMYVVCEEWLENLMAAF